MMKGIVSARRVLTMVACPSTGKDRLNKHRENDERHFGWITGIESRLDANTRPAPTMRMRPSTSKPIG